MLWYSGINVQYSTVISREQQNASTPDLHHQVVLEKKRVQQCMKLLYEAKLCFIFPNARSELHFPMENIVPKIVLRIYYNKLPLTLMHYGKILHTGMVSKQI